MVLVFNNLNRSFIPDMVCPMIRFVGLIRWLVFLHHYFVRSFVPWFVRWLVYFTIKFAGGFDRFIGSCCWISWSVYLLHDLVRWIDPLYHSKVPMVRLFHDVVHCIDSLVPLFHDWLPSLDRFVNLFCSNVWFVWLFHELVGGIDQFWLIVFHYLVCSFIPWL